MYVCMSKTASFMDCSKCEAILSEAGGVLNVTVEEKLEMLLFNFWWL